MNCRSASDWFSGSLASFGVVKPFRVDKAQLGPPSINQFVTRRQVSCRPDYFRPMRTGVLIEELDKVPY